MIIPIKTCWLEMIAKGIKKQEYRGLKPYWEARIEPLIAPDGHKYVYEIFRAGYSKTSPSIMCYGYWDVGAGKPEWGAAPEVEYYRFNILSVRERRR